ncbi:MAG: type II toxin-antitoxin system mRNA interferase toxin, RelE/StbE family [Patescibacteria group bacterium]|nr:type II toxin-antitoxin system mRNA interferase toxin, RelE/StbE family [Patescibacteria group bacterium]
MVDIFYTPPFLRQLKKLELGLQEEVIEKVEIFRQDPQNPALKTHKLHGRLKDRYSFSVNYKTRIVFSYLSSTQAVFLAVGDCEVYR